MTLKEIIKKDIHRHPPITFAVESMAFPFISWLLGASLIFYSQKAGDGMGLAALVFLPLILIAIGIIIIGILLGIILSVTAVSIARKLTTDKRGILYKYARMGLILSLAEFAYFLSLFS